MPANLENIENTIDNLPKEKVYILDQYIASLSKYPAIYQNFEKDIFEGLSSGLSRILNYKTFVLQYSEDKQPKGILKGFYNFCNKNDINHQVVSSIKNRTPKKGEIYMVLEDKNLIRIIKKII